MLFLGTICPPHVPDVYTCSLSPNLFPLVDSGSAVTFYVIKNEWADTKIIPNKTKLVLRSLSLPPYLLPPSLHPSLTSLWARVSFCLCVSASPLIESGGSSLSPCCTQLFLHADLICSMGRGEIEMGGESQEHAPSSPRAFPVPLEPG